MTSSSWLGSQAWQGTCWIASQSLCGQTVRSVDLAGSSLWQWSVSAKRETSGNNIPYLVSCSRNSDMALQNFYTAAESGTRKWQSNCMHSHTANSTDARMKMVGQFLSLSPLYTLEYKLDSSSRTSLCNSRHMSAMAHLIWKLIITGAIVL